MWAIVVVYLIAWFILFFNAHSIQCILAKTGSLVMFKKHKSLYWSFKLKNQNVFAITKSQNTEQSWGNNVQCWFLPCVTKFLRVLIFAIFAELFSIHQKRTYKEKTPAKILFTGKLIPTINITSKILLLPSATQKYDVIDTTELLYAWGVIEKRENVLISIT